MPAATERVATPPTSEWPPHLVQYLRACLWRKMLIQHEGIHGIVQWLFAGGKDPISGERIPYSATVESLYPSLLEAATRWADKRNEGR